MQRWPSLEACWWLWNEGSSQKGRLWNEGKEEEIKRSRESGWGLKKNNRKPSDSNAAPANPSEIKQPTGTSRRGSGRATSSPLSPTEEMTFSRTLSWKCDVTSALSLLQCARSECERMQTFGSWLLGFLWPCFLFLFSFIYFFPAYTQSFSGLIWINPGASKEPFAVIIWITNWSHMKNKGTKQKSKKKGSDNAFGCDLIEHLESSGQDGKRLTLLHFPSKTLFNY